MNTTNCPFGWATDNIFQLPSQSIPCGSSLLAFWILASILSLLRFVSAGRRFRNWLKPALSKLRKRPKYPYSSFISLFAAVFEFLLFFLSGLNISNVFNGASFALVSLAFIPFIIDVSIALVRLVRLGKLIIPLKCENLDALNQLQNFELLGKALFALQILCAIVSCIALVIVSPIHPNNDQQLGRVGFAFK